MAAALAGMNPCLSGQPDRAEASLGAGYLALARAAAGGARNGVPAGRIAVGFPGAGFGPTRVSVVVRGRPRLRLPGRRRRAALPLGTLALRVAISPISSAASGVARLFPHLAFAHRRLAR
jgi:hypothetical protein